MLVIILVGSVLMALVLSFTDKRKYLGICIILAVVCALMLYLVSTNLYDTEVSKKEFELMKINLSSENETKFEDYVFESGKECIVFYKDSVTQIHGKPLKIGEKTKVIRKNDISPHMVEITTVRKTKINRILLFLLIFSVPKDEVEKTYTIYTS